MTRARTGCDGLVNETDLPERSLLVHKIYQEDFKATQGPSDPPDTSSLPQNWIQILFNHSNFIWLNEITSLKMQNQSQGNAIGVVTHSQVNTNTPAFFVRAVE